MGLTIHPRVKRQVGARLAQAAWSLYYNHPEVAYTGPVVSGCTINTANAADDSVAVSAGTSAGVVRGAGAGGVVGAGGKTLTVTFNTTLLGKDEVVVSDYNQTERASVFWVLTKPIPGDADKNWLYTNRQAWWGDDISVWQNVNIKAGKGTIFRNTPFTVC